MRRAAGFHPKYSISCSLQEPNLYRPHSTVLPKQYHLQSATYVNNSVMTNFLSSLSITTTTGFGFLSDLSDSGSPVSGRSWDISPRLATPKLTRSANSFPNFITLQSMQPETLLNSSSSSGKGKFKYEFNAKQ